jgi:hypothetical protein
VERRELRELRRLRGLREKKILHPTPLLHAPLNHSLPLFTVNW